jgi:hypothetical protein
MRMGWTKAEREKEGGADVAATRSASTFDLNR